MFRYDLKWTLNAPTHTYIHTQHSKWKYSNGSEKYKRKKYDPGWMDGSELNERMNKKKFVELKKEKHEAERIV